MKIKNIKPVGKRKVYDLSVKDAEHYVLENGIVTHNTGSYYSADNIWILGRKQDKPDDEIVGYHFSINIEKSRFVKEKSKIPITISFEGGINRWSGLLELAVEGNYLAKQGSGWYAVVNRDTGEIEKPNKRTSEIVNNKDFWMNMFEKTDFAKYIEETYKVSYSNIIQDEEKDDE